MRRLGITALLGVLLAGMVVSVFAQSLAPPVVPAEASGIARIERVRTLPPALQPAAVPLLPDTAWTVTTTRDQLAGAEDGRGWWRVYPHPIAVDGALLLLVYHPYSARVTVLAPPDYRVQTASIFDPPRQAAHSRRALTFPLREQGSPQPIYIGVEQARYPLQVAVRLATAHAIEDYGHVRVLWLSLGILVGVSLVVLLFWLRLRERVYLLFAASMTLQMMYVLLAYGDAYGLTPFAWLARFGVAGIWFVATLSTIVTVYFLLEFADLRPRAPWLSRLLWLVGAALPALLLVLLVLPWPQDKSWFPPFGNSLLLLANGLAIVTLCTVWLRGGRHAGFVLIAWVPLVSVSTARAMQLSSGAPLAPWLEYGLPVMEAFAAVVLVLGLADRMLTFRRERDVAQQHAQHDPLTGVFNRAGIINRLDHAVGEARRHKLPLSVLFLDLDHFKRINDTHGHAVGDACLSMVTEVIRSEMHHEQQLGRIGGEEFLLLLPGMGRRHARDVAEQIRKRVEMRCRTIKHSPVELTLSVGVVELHHTDNAASLIERADEAMYRAKHEGRNRVVVLESAAA